MSARAVPARAAFVVKSFYDAGDSLSGTMGLSFMILSMAVVWLAGIGSALGFIAGVIGDDGPMANFSCKLLSSFAIFVLVSFKCLNSSILV